MNPRTVVQRSVSPLWVLTVSLTGELMSLARKHSRQIVVAGVRYRWRYRKRKSEFRFGMGDRVVVEAADLNDARLVVQIGHNWDYEYSLTPQHVADFIEDAIGAGWRPLERGPKFDILVDSPRRG